MFNKFWHMLWEVHYQTKELFLLFPKYVLYPFHKDHSVLNNIKFESNAGGTEKAKKVEVKSDESSGGSNYERRQYIGLFLGPVLFILMLVIPEPYNMTSEAQKMAAITLIMSTWWICESIPIPATSLLPLILMPLLGITSTKHAALPYASDIIFLYMGGFFIALATQRWGLHRRIAMNIIRIIGFSPKRVILGFMVATAAISAFVSNTATAVMMMPIGLAIITHVIEEGKKEGIDKEIDFSPGKFNFGLNLMLGIACAASIGGIATIIGTPPNAILVGYLKETYNFQITFAKWIIVGVPFATVMIPVSWVLLLKLNPLKLKKIPGGKEIIYKELKDMGKMNTGERLTAIVFFLTGLCWIFIILIQKIVPYPQFFSDATVAMTGGLLLFILPVSLKKNIFVLNWEWAKKLPWGVLILFGGGLSMADGIASTKLAEWIGLQVKLLQFAPIVVIIFLVALFAIALSEVTSNTATAAMIIPILSAVAVGTGQNPLLFTVPATIAVSCPFMLPVATPPNAIVFGTGYITIPQMVKSGFWRDCIAVVFSVIVTYLCLIPFFDISLGVMPSWVASK